MAYAIQYTRSLFFLIQMYLMMVVFGLLFCPLVSLNRKYSYLAVHVWCRWVRWTAAWMVGLKSEVRGVIPDHEFIIAAKHQSFFDIILIVSETPRPKFIMKSSLRWAPVLGWYAKKIGCVAVERGKRTEAIQKMMSSVASGTAPPGQLIIYPQGTRVAPGDFKPYKIGVAALYQQTGQECLPVACNVGLFWPKYGVMRKPGLAVVECLPVIPKGLENSDLMNELENVIEKRTNELLAESTLK